MGVKELGKWQSASHKLVHYLNIFINKEAQLESAMAHFMSFNESHALHGKHAIDNAYAKVRELKAQCDNSLGIMGNCGDEMKHYSNLNKAKLYKLMMKIEKRRSDLNNLALKEEKERQKQLEIRRKIDLREQKKREKEEILHQKQLEKEAYLKRKQEKKLRRLSA